jgi:hypothetical protein
MGRSPKYIGIGGAASIWSLQITFTVFDLNIGLGVDAESIGFQAGLNNEFKL